MILGAQRFTTPSVEKKGGRRVKNYANISMGKLADLIQLKTTHGRAAVNASSRYSDGTHLLQIPVRLYILLHFYADSNSGKALNLNPDTLASDLSVNVKSVRAALRKLAKEGYIILIEDADYVDVTISNINDMYKKSGNGGKGYISCGPDLRNAIIKVTKINDLRVIIRSLLHTVSNELHTASKRAEARISMKEYREGLPKYVKPCVIRNAASGDIFSSLFERLRNDGKESYFIRLRPDMNAHHTKNKIRTEARIRINSDMASINKVVRQANLNIHEFEGVLASDMVTFQHHDIELGPEWFMTKKHLPLLELNAGSIDSCASLAQDFGIDSVIKAIHTMFSKVAAGSIILSKKSDAGGIIRKIINEMFQFDVVTA